MPRVYPVLQVPSAPTRVTPCSALGFYSAFLQLRLAGWCWGSTDLAPCPGASPRWLSLQLQPFPTASGLWASWDLCVLRSKQPFPNCEVHKATNCGKEKRTNGVNGHMGPARLIRGGFPVLFVAVTPLKRRLLTSWVLRLVCF